MVPRNSGFQAYMCVFISFIIECVCSACRIQYDDVYMLCFLRVNPFKTAAPFWGTNYLEFDWFVPKNGTAVLKGFCTALPIRRHQTQPLSVPILQS